jgi:hypothetical protein
MFKCQKIERLEISKLQHESRNFVERCVLSQERTNENHEKQSGMR